MRELLRVLLGAPRRRRLVVRGVVPVHDLLPFIVAGIATGAVYGLAGTGLVLTYKTSGIFNFGHGAIATAGAYAFYYLHVDKGWDWRPALILSVLVLGPLLGLLMERMARVLAQQSTSYKIVATIGLILLVQGLATVKYGSDTIAVDQFLPKPLDSFELGGVNVQYPQLWVALVALIAVVLLYCLFRWSRAGLAMRGVVDDSDLLAMQGTNPVRVRRTSWVIGATFASLSGVLVLPFAGLNAITLTFLVVQAFGAASLGAFSNLPLTFAGGLLIGIGSSISTKYTISVEWLSGLPDSLPFLVLFVTLLVLPRRHLVPPSWGAARARLEYRAPNNVRAVTGLLVVLPLLLIPTLVGPKLSYYTVGLTQVVLLLSLGLLVRLSGQVSLCHVAFAGIGACVFSQLTVEHQVPWLLAVLLAGLVVVPVGALVAVPAIRLSGLFLALATFGFGILIERLVYSRGFLFTSLASGRRMPRPGWAEGDRAWYYLVLAFVVVTALFMVALTGSRLGRVLRGLSDAPVAVGTLGLSTNVTKVMVFCLSAFFAGVAGVLYGCSVVYATTVDPNYSSFYSLVLLAVLAIAPFREPWYALFMGVTSVIPAYITTDHTRDWLNVLFGLFAIIVALQGGTQPMPARLRARMTKLAWPRPVARAAQESAGSAARPSLPRRSPGPTRTAPGLELTNLRVAFGGLVAIDDLSLSAPLGRITGLIGPNGAGKTTAFNACSGLNRRVSGVIAFRERDVGRDAPAERARRGLGRTFQIMELGDSLSVWDNVALGSEAGMAGRSPLTQLTATRSQARATAAATAEALDMCGIAHLAELQAGALSTGQRRLVELARCLAGSFDLLLLDEPSSGLDRDETSAFSHILQRVVAQRGCGILLVEHDMSLVMNVCEYLYVLDFGRLIFEGGPGVVAASSLVRAAYLGEDNAELDRQADRTTASPLTGGRSS